MKVEGKIPAMENGATYKKKSKLSVFSPRDFQESEVLDRPVQGEARNLALERNCGVPRRPPVRMVDSSE